VSASRASFAAIASEGDVSIPLQDSSRNDDRGRWCLSTCCAILYYYIKEKLIGEVILFARIFERIEMGGPKLQRPFIGVSAITGTLVIAFSAGVRHSSALLRFENDYQNGVRWIVVVGVFETEEDLCGAV